MLPRELAAVADSIGCGPIPGFFARDGMIEPPFVYGVLEGRRDSSATFWCSAKADGGARLVITGPAYGTRQFSWWNPPGGLSIVREASIVLTEFRQLSDPSKAGPAHTLAAATAIRSEYDGVYVLFVEYRGEWYYRIFH